MKCCTVHRIVKSGTITLYSPYVMLLKPLIGFKGRIKLYCCRLHNKQVEVNKTVHFNSAWCNIKNMVELEFSNFHRKYLRETWVFDVTLHANITVYRLFSWETHLGDWKSRDTVYNLSHFTCCKLISRIVPLLKCNKQSFLIKNTITTPHLSHFRWEGGKSH